MPKSKPDQELRLLKFAASVCNSMDVNIFRKVYIGIDPGAEGAIGFISGPYSTVVDIPNYRVKRGKKKTKTVFNYAAIISLFDCLGGIDSSRVIICVEEPPPNMGKGQGSSYGQFRLGCAYAMWPLFLLSKAYKVETVLPSAWKRRMGLTPDKKHSLQTARNKFKDSEHLLKRVKDHNRAEALLLAEYARRKTEG